MFAGPSRSGMPSDFSGQSHPSGIYPPAPMMPMASRPPAVPLSEEEFYRLQEMERRSAVEELTNDC